MSLWTPSGEHRVDREPPAPGPPGAGSGPGGTPGSTSGGTPGAPGAPGGQAGGGADDATRQAAAEAEEMRRELARTPAEVIVANHCYGLFELAAVYLSQSPPQLDHARLAIDSLGFVVEGLAERLGETRATLSDALAQIRLAYVQMDAAEQARATGAAQGSGTRDGPAA